MNRKSHVHAHLAAIVATVLTLASTTPARAIKVGAPAPDFHGTDSNGKTQSLNQYKASTWCSNGTITIALHHQALPERKHAVAAKQWTAKGVVWFTVISSAPGEQGYVDAGQENAT